MSSNGLKRILRICFAPPSVGALSLLLGAACGSGGGDAPPTTMPNEPSPVGPSDVPSSSGDPGVSPAPTSEPDVIGVTPDEPPLILDPGDSTPTATGGFMPSEKLDLLFVVDNSSSMGDKQAIFKDAVRDMIDQLVNPPCLDKATQVFVDVPAGQTCPAGSQRIFNPVKDIHIGIISSSLGPRGAVDDEIPSGCEDAPRGNDKAHLIPFMREGFLESTYQSQGFLAWDPDQKQAPPGTADLETLITDFQAQVDAVGEDGCGFEAPLEAAYRFLVDPEPYATVERVPCGGGDADTPLCAAPTGIDQELLTQRANFLRPDSVVVVMYLTDENDCSIRTAGQGFFALRELRFLGSGTTTCSTDPNSECCHSCNLPDASVPAACPSKADNGCETAEAVDTVESFNLRCYKQKERFGIDFLRSTSIYSQGFTSTKVGNRNNDPVDNPLVTQQRGKEKVFVVGLVGVPWQSTATEETLASPNDLALRRDDQTNWDLFLGAPPLDAFNHESTAQRLEGTNPFTNEVIGPPGTWNAINGHDRPIEPDDGLVDDLQYSCIFPLAEPRACDGEATSASCDCAIEPGLDGVLDYATNNPLCYDVDTDSYGTTQYYAKAYPAPRIVQVLKDVGVQGVLASICPKQLSAADQQDYAYRPVIRALLQNVASQVAR